MDNIVFSLNEHCEKISDEIDAYILKLLEPYGINKDNVEEYINNDKLNITEYRCDRIPNPDSIISIVLDNQEIYKIKKTLEWKEKSTSPYCIFYIEYKLELMDVDK